MTLEYLEIMEEMNQIKNEELISKSSSRRKLQRSFKSNTRIYDDGSIEVDPQTKRRTQSEGCKEGG